MPRNVLEALFDIRPMTKSGFLDLEKINQVRTHLNLKVKKDNISPRLLAPEITVSRVKDGFFEEFEKTISEPTDIVAELAKVGGELLINRKSKKSARCAKLEEFWEKNNTGRFCSHGERELDIWLDLFRNNQDVFVSSEITQSSACPPEKERIIAPKIVLAEKKKQPVKSRLIAIFLMIGAMATISYGFRGGIGIKKDILISGSKAVTNLEKAKESLENLDFLSAADDFALAYDDFGEASSRLNSLGASFLSNFSNIPGLEKVKSANNLVKAGQNISKAGENLALAFNTLSKTNFLAKTSLSKLIGEFKNVLIYADNNITQAQELIAEVDTKSLPENKQQLFIDFKEKIPQFQQYIGRAINYSDFLLDVVGNKSEKKYLVLLQNNSELRATGGFPGTYALVTFSNGFLKDVKIDDVYNIDGQLKENFVPPEPLQHITPNWGMRDANWFADFPTSAKKVEEFYYKDGGGNVDGVLSLTPKVIGQILDIVGPIDMPEYGIKLDSNNFLAEIQEEVEYGANRVQPKTILKDVQPKLFEKLAQQDSSKWLEIFKILTKAVEEKHILAYFNNPELEKVALKNNLAGEIKKTNNDYLQIVFSNVKGSKTDAVIDSAFDLDTTIGADTVTHKLTIARTHNGGGSQLGFYNKINPTYVRIYLPLGSGLKSISGNSLPDYRPLIGHEDYNFKKDPDLAAIELTTVHPFTGVDVFEESGKTVFGFWLVLNPKQTKSVTILYESAVSPALDSYNLFWQKQSGTDKDLFSLEISSLGGKQTIINSDLSIDREVQLKLADDQ